MYKIVLAILVQVAFFGFLAYVDAAQTVRPSWAGVVKFGLKPYILSVLLLGPFALWWSYRIIYSAMAGKFWATSFITLLIVVTVGLFCRWLGSGVDPGRGDFIGIALIFLAILASKFI